MPLLDRVPRRAVNLPGSSLFTILGALLTGRVRTGPQLAEFERAFGAYIGAPHVLGAAQGRSAFQLALAALDLPKGAEIVFPAFTFPVMPMVAKLMGYEPVFSPVDPRTYNSGPKEIEPVLGDKTGAVLATHLFGLPCDIEGIVALAQQRGFKVMEDCAHALGVKVNGKRVGTFGDIGVFSFAEGKNMPCFGGGVITTADDAIAARAKQALEGTEVPPAGELVKKALSVWTMWLLTRPTVFGLTAYPALRLKAARGDALMDSAVGDELLATFAAGDPKITRLGNLQASVGLRQLERIDAFNEGARKNAEILTRELGEVPGIRVPPADGDHIYVYYPITVDPKLREDLRVYLLKRGIDTKRTDMADCSTLEAFRREGDPRSERPPAEATLLEICVYPIMSEAQMKRVARVIREWSEGAVAQGRVAKEQRAAC